MIEFKFDSDNENIIVDYIKEMIRQNPILLDRILEEPINEIISDFNIPEKIKQLIDVAIVPNAELKDKIHEAISDAVSNAMSEQNSETMIKESIDSKLETDEYKLILTNAVENSIDTRQVDEQIETAVDNLISNEFGNGGNSIDRMVNEQISETLSDEHIDYESLTKEVIEDEIKSSDTQHLIKECIQKKIEVVDIVGNVKDTIKELITKDEIHQIIKNECKVLFDESVKNKEQLPISNEYYDADISKNKIEDRIEVREGYDYNKIIIDIHQKERTNDIVKTIQMIIQPNSKLTFFPKG